MCLIKSLTAVLMLWSSICFAGDQTLTGVITEVRDGDTFTVKVDHHSYWVQVRLFGVDAPELDQDFGEKSRYFARQWIGRSVELTVRGHSFHRLVCEVYLREEDMDLGFELVRHGLAWQEPRYSRDESLQQLQETARKERRGLWQNKHAVPPWEHRKRPKLEKTLDQVQRSFPRATALSLRAKVNTENRLTHWPRRPYSLAIGTYWS